MLRITNGKRVMLLLCAAAVSAPALGDARFSEWSNTAMVPGVAGGCPIESRDANHLYVAGGFDGTLDIWIHRRSGRPGDFGPREKAAEPVSLDDANDFCPTPLPGGWLLFVSDRPGGCGGTDMYLARYNPVGPEPTSDSASNLGCYPDGPNTTGSELSPSLVTTSEGTVLYYSTDVGGTQDIYRSDMSIVGSFSGGTAVIGVNTAAFQEQQPNVSKDGLEMVFSSNRHGTQDVFTASRDSIDDAWSDVRNLTIDLGLPTVDGNETRASMSWDRKRLYYGSGGTIFVSERKPGRKPEPRAR
jgi:Tol biopolymer transport system component